ncbi:MAG TPA: FAD-dependent oxidoreductase [Desulfuromonadales bacterium]|nr:FAD-dependent oxidoreductase [Desulfuromonadales bacterium]
MKTWQCEVCGYIHSGAEPPLSCPICGAGQDCFTALEISMAAAGPVATDAWHCPVCSYLHRAPEPPSNCPVCSATGSLFTPFHCGAASVASSDDIQRIVILGGGIAGLTAAAEARRQAPHTSITLVSREQSLPYYRLNLTRFLAGDISESELQIESGQWFEEHAIQYVHAEATALDREQKQVRLRDGRLLDYDRLVLTNGAHPFIPPFPGATRDGVTVLRTLEDARAILQRLRPGMQLVCIGGGLLGLETAGALARQGATVTVVEGFASLLPRQLPPRAGSLLRQRLEAQGMTVFCGETVKELVGDESVQGVLLESGRLLPADLVVVAAGVRPNSYLARQAGLTVHRGIVVDDRLISSDPSILAAGDVAEHRGMLYGIWPAGYAQGAVAGCNAGGGTALFGALAASTRIKVLDVDLFSCGQIHPEDASTTVYESEHDGVYRAIYCCDGQLTGAVLYGDTAGAGRLKEIVESGRQISEFPELAELFPRLAASREERKKV